jgi:polyketide synthase PksN
MQKLIDFSGIDLGEHKKDKIPTKDIAIIGLSARLGGTRNTNELWQLLADGKDTVKPFPQARKVDVENYLQAIKAKFDNMDFHVGSYMEEIDKFDPDFFQISQKEAERIDPHQRLFLEAAWQAITDAGYRSEDLSGKKVGVFIGYSSDFGEEYKKLVSAMDPAAIKLATTGNIKSVIAGRVSYLLDLHGPCMVIDTACSSSLVAVHEACRSIRGGECEAAVVGGVKILLMPLKTEHGPGMGLQILDDIISADGKTKTFDDSADGTLPGEGVAAILLKPLTQAVADGDLIYAVIKGSAVNSDGRSLGITAPNSAAQEEVIKAAWRDAAVHPETITYIEAHGTGTKLGDIVEISGLEKAFQKYTNRSQFCAIGSIKTNIGHLDSAAGIAGLIKAVLALHKKKLPPSLNFSLPNRNMSFIKSPVFINNSLRNWDTSGFPRRCGVSSFGLSGTNCHIVLEEAPTRERDCGECQHDLHIFTVSAKSEYSLKEQMKSYYNYFNSDQTALIQDICFTANTTREHYPYRIAMLIRGIEDLECKLAQIHIGNYQYEQVRDVYYGQCKVVSRQKEVMALGEITEKEKKNLTRETEVKLATLSAGQLSTDQYKNLCSLYVRGADVAWSLLYQNHRYTKVSLPTYAFKEIRCFVERQNEQVNSPLIHSCIVKSMNLEIYRTLFQVEQDWVLNEHKVLEKYVVPGTVYIEMIRTVLTKENRDASVVITDLKYITPLALADKESREAQLIVQKQDKYLEITIVSRNEFADKWEVHASAIADYETEEQQDNYDIDALYAEFKQSRILNYHHSAENLVRAGQRWDCYEQIYQKGEEYLSVIKLKEHYHRDLFEYYLHPAMMDCGLNTANSFIGDGYYLPFAYKRMKIYGATPSSFYSYLKRRKKQIGETVVFDIVLLDEQGRVFLEVEEYIIKKVRMNHVDALRQKKPNLYHQLRWVKKEAEYHLAKHLPKKVLLFCNTAVVSEEIQHEFSALGKESIVVRRGKTFQRISETSYIVGDAAADYEKLMQHVGTGLSMIIHMLSIAGERVNERMGQLVEALQPGVYSLFYVMKALTAQKIKENIQFVLVSDYGTFVSTSQQVISPLNSAIIGLSKVIGKEFAKVSCRIIDIDQSVRGQELLSELLAKAAPTMVALRDKQRYVEEFGTAAFPPQLYQAAIKEGGSYVIAGGTGGLGLQIAQYMAVKKNVKIALLSRSGLPDRANWEQVTDGEVREKIKMIQSMESKGAKIACYAVNIANFEGMKAVLHDFRLKYGSIQGIIHCAGLAGDGFLFRKEEAVFRSVFEPKIHGCHVLENLTKQDDLDFFVMFSSITSVVNLAGQGDYTAANAFMDSFAHYMHGLGRKALSIRWAPWQETGMAVNHVVAMDKGAFQPVTNEEGLDALEQIICTQADDIIVGRLNEENFAQISEQYRLADDFKQLAERTKSDTRINKEREPKGFANITMIGKQETSFSKTEIAIAKIWANFLGRDTIDIYESFYAMGGDSLMATELMKEIEAVFPNLIDVTDIFTYPTVEELSHYIEQKMGQTIAITKGTEIETEPAQEEITIAWIVDQLSRHLISPKQADQMITDL